MSNLLQKIMMALGRRGVQVPIDSVLGMAYRSLQDYLSQYPAVFPAAAEILLSEVEGGATSVTDIPKRMGHLCEMLDRLQRQEDLAIWTDPDRMIAV